MKRFLLLLLTLALTGCLGDVPTSGTIQFGRENNDRGQENFVRAIVSPPAPGADPVGIVRGFLAAAAADDEEFKTARLYLTGQVRDSWKPAGPKRIVDDRSVAWEYDNLRSPGSVIYRANQVGELGTDGQLQDMKQERVEQYRLVLVDKEWRIAALPDGITLTTSDLQRTYRQVRLFFPNPSLQLLIPISLYVPVRPGLATSLTRALLRGPVGWLAPALTTAFPKGSALTVDAVPISNGVASVDLNTAAATAPSSRRNVMAAQLGLTLQQVREFRELKLTAGGSAIPVSSESWNRFSIQKTTSDPIVSFSNDRGLAWQRLTGATQYFSSTTSDTIKGYTAPVLSPDRATLVAIDSAGGLATGNASRYPVGQQNGFQITGLTTVLQPVGRVASVQWDLDGNYWLLDRATPSRIWVGRRADVPVQVALPNSISSPTGASRGVIESFGISRDGLRLFLSLRQGGTSQLLMLRVVRSGKGITAQAPRSIIASSDAISAISSIQGDEIAVLSGKRRILFIDLNTLAQTNLLSIPSSVAIAAQPGAPIIIETDDHRLLIRRNQSWSLLTTGRDPNYGG